MFVSSTFDRSVMMFLMTSGEMQCALFKMKRKKRRDGSKKIVSLLLLLNITTIDNKTK